MKTQTFKASRACEILQRAVGNAQYIPCDGHPGASNQVYGIQISGLESLTIKTDFDRASRTESVSRESLLAFIRMITQNRI
jgi:hypothetical protein